MRSFVKFVIISVIAASPIVLIKLWSTNGANQRAVGLEVAGSNGAAGAVSSVPDSELDQEAYYAKHRPACPGEAVGIPPRYLDGKADLKKGLLTRPMPDVRLIFRVDFNTCRPKVKAIRSFAQVELSAQITRDLRAHWTRALSYWYQRNFEAVPNEVQQNRRIEYACAWGTTALILKGHSINAPDGHRHLSLEESAKLLAYLHDSARTLVEEALRAQSRPRSPIV